MKDKLSVFVLTLCGLCVVSQLYILLPVTSNLAEMFEINASQAGFLTGFFGFAYASGFLIWGPLSDIYGRKIIMIGGLSLLSVFTLALCFYPTFLSFMAGRIFQGFVAAAFPPIALVWVAENLPDRLKMTATGCLSTAFLLAGLLGQIYGSLTIKNDLFLAMVPLAIFYLLSAAYLFTIQAHPSGSQTRGSILKSWASIPSLLVDRNLSKYYMAALVLLASFVAFYTALSFQGTFLSQSGVSLMTLRLVGIPGMLIPLFSGRLISKHGHVRIISTSMIVAGSAVTTIAVLLFLQISTFQAPLLIALVCLFVAGIASTVPAIIAAVSIGRPDQRGLAVALYTFILFVGASIGSLIPTRNPDLSLPGLFIIIGLLLIVFGSFPLICRKKEGGFTNE